MVNFVNSFSFATNENRSEIIVRFSQQISDPVSGDVSNETVSDLIMPGELAVELVRKLGDVLNTER